MFQRHAAPESSHFPLHPIAGETIKIAAKRVSRRERLFQFLEIWTRQMMLLHSMAGAIRRHAADSACGY
jgi:hypothetical protein